MRLHEHRLLFRERFSDGSKLPWRPPCIKPSDLHRHIGHVAQTDNLIRVEKPPHDEPSRGRTIGIAPQYGARIDHRRAIGERYDPADIAPLVCAAQQFRTLTEETVKIIG